MIIQDKKNKDSFIKIRKKRKERKGIVTSDKMDKTVIVSEIKRVKHKFYEKRILKRKKYMVHDEKNISKKGDVVFIMETRPISKKKCWRLVSVLEKKKEILK